MVVDASRLPDALVELHVEEYPSRAGEIMCMLVLHPGIDDLLHLLLEDTLGLRGDVLPSVLFDESPDFVCLFKVPLDRARLIPIIVSAKIMRLDHRAAAELGMEFGKHTLDFGIVAV